MKEIKKTLIEALVLVIIVVFLFLPGWRATLIPLLAMPVSSWYLALFPLFGFSIDALSLFGLVLAVGLVVDDAIVVVEAVEHHIEHGMSPKDATFKAMEEVSGPVIAIAIILAAVCRRRSSPASPGACAKQLAVTIAVSVIVCAFNALTLSPTLASLLRPKRSREAPWPFLSLVQQNVRRRHGRLCGTLRLAHPQRHIAAAPCRHHSIHRFSSAKTLPPVFPSRRSRVHVCQGATARCGFLAAR